MRLSWPVTLASLCLALAACKGDDVQPGDTPASTSTTAPTAPTTGPGPTSTGAPDTSTGGTTTTGEPTTTTGAPTESCAVYTDVDSCEFAAGCKWDSVFTYTHGATGCQADVVDFCTAEAGGAASTWYRGDAGDVEVVRFEVTPDDLPPEWKPCDCDGPLACLCALDAPECPDRVQEFCGAAKNEASCDNAAINGTLRCEWFVIQPEGPADDTCSGQAFKPTCLAADNAAADDCTKLNLQPAYGDECASPVFPVFWRVVDGVVEVTKDCGPVPPAPEWTPCSETDTPEQPDECKCACL